MVSGFFGILGMSGKQRDARSREPFRLPRAIGAKMIAGQLVSDLVGCGVPSLRDDPARWPLLVRLARRELDADLSGLSALGDFLVVRCDLPHSTLRLGVGDALRHHSRVLRTFMPVF